MHSVAIMFNLSVGRFRSTDFIPISPS